ncbi:ferredoxin [Streptomyces sp. NPDC008343]|uniref:ferredoxin n=1 Tax=Streptomyces sp. NPDC008343 TaxID=3364828 RepID=UPI0036EF4E0C
MLIAPEVLDQRDEDGIVTLLEPSPAEGVQAAAREAAAVCPASAITIDGDQEENQLLRPRPAPYTHHTSTRRPPLGGASS